MCSLNVIGDSQLLISQAAKGSERRPCRVAHTCNALFKHRVLAFDRLNFAAYAIFMKIARISLVFIAPVVIVN
jgi:hypothetical protein